MISLQGTIELSPLKSGHMQGTVVKTVGFEFYLLFFYTAGSY